jgi:hypothetical protein
MNGTHVRLLLALGYGVAVAGCTGWQSVDPSAKPVVSADNVLEFEAGGKTVRLYAVKVGSDSVSGVAHSDHIARDTCRVAYAIAEMSHAKMALWHQGSSEGFATFALVSAIVGIFLWKLPGVFGTRPAP